MIYLVIVSTKAVDTMDLARVRRRRSVVRDFTVTAPAPTVFYLELLNLRLCLALENLAWEYFWPHFEKQVGRQSCFSTFFLSFSSFSYSGCVIATVFKLSAGV